MMIIGFFVVIVIAGSLLLGYLYEQHASTEERKKFLPPGSLVDLGGRRIHLFVKGNADGPTVVIEPGAGEPSMLWWFVQDQIATFARVCTYDRPGYQWSDPPALEASLEDRARDLHEVLTRGNVPGPYVLVAHSYGGAIARLFARDHLTDVAGVVLVDTPDEELLFGQRYASVIAKCGWILAVATFVMQTGIVRLWSALFAGRDQKAEPNLSSQAQHFWAMAFTPQGLKAATDELASITRTPPALRAKGAFGLLGDVPLIVLAHGQPFPGMFATLEVGFRESQIRLAALSSNSELIVVENANHNINMDAPEIVVDAVKRIHHAARDRSRLQV